MSEDRDDAEDTTLPDAPPQVKLRHRWQYGLFRAVEWVLGLFSLPMVARAGAALGLVAHALSAKHRQLVRRNLRIATAGQAQVPGEEELDRLVKETFRRAGANLLGSQRAATMRPADLRAHLELEGFEHLLVPLRAGRGVVLVWGHMGNWEVLAQLIREVGGDIEGGPIYRPLENPLLDELTVRRRTQEGAVLFSKHDGFNGPAALLRRGGVVTVMTDQRAGGHGELCPFFGRLSSCTPLPAILARRTGSAMVTLSISSHPQKAGRWVLRIRPVPEKAKTREVLQHLEMAMRDSLPDVFWFHDRWRVDKTVPLGFFTKEAPAGPAANATQVTRMAATLPPGNPEAVEVLVALLELRPDLRIELLGDSPALPDDARIIHHSNKSLAACDATHAVPLDFALLLDGDEALAQEAKELGLRAIVGIQKGGKPWTRSFPAMPATREAWRELAVKLVLTGKALRR